MDGPVVNARRQYDGLQIIAIECMLADTVIVAYRCRRVQPVRHRVKCCYNYLGLSQNRLTILRAE